MIIFNSILPNADLKTNFYNAGSVSINNSPKIFINFSTHIHLVYFVY